MALLATKQWYLCITTVVPCEHCREVALVSQRKPTVYYKKKHAQSCNIYNCVFLIDEVKSALGKVCNAHTCSCSKNISFWI